MTAYLPADLLAIVRAENVDDRTALAMLVGAYLESGANPDAVGPAGDYGTWQLHNDPKGTDTAYAAHVMAPRYASAVASVDPALWTSDPARAAETAVYRAERPSRDYYASQGSTRVTAAYQWALSAFPKGPSMSAIYPGAVWRPASNHSGPMSAHLGLVLHVQVGNGSIFNEANNPASQASYTWWVSKSGVLEQYVDADLTAWAQAAGNSTYNSIGTEGGVDSHGNWVEEPLTDAQMAQISNVYRWGHDRYGWSFQLAETPGQHGFGWHGMGAPAWGHALCPGVVRRDQRQHILDLTQNQGDDLTPDESRMLSELHTLFLKPVGEVNAGVPWGVNETLNDVRALQTDMAVVKADVAAIKAKTGA